MPVALDKKVPNPEASSLLSSLNVATGDPSHIEKLRRLMTLFILTNRGIGNVAY